MRRFLNVFLMLALTGWTAAAAAARQPVKRTVLGLYNGTYCDGDYANTSIHQRAESVLNYLGYRVVPWDVAAGLPPAAALDSCAAVFSWFGNPGMDGAYAYLTWLEQVIDRGIKVIIWEKLGAIADTRTGKATPAYKINRVLNRLGLSYRGFYEENPLFIRVARQDSAMFGFERPLDRGTPAYDEIVSYGPRNTVHLSLTLASRPGERADPGVTGPWGGAVFGNCLLYMQDYREQDETVVLQQWYVDPFLFFRTALADADIPRPDAAVKNGRRIFYSHIDGDGLVNVSKTDRETFCGRIIADRVLRRYRLPVTVSFITSEVDPDRLGSADILSMARDIAALPNVELASHSFSHPFVWSAGQKEKFHEAYGDVFSLPLRDYRFDIAAETGGSAGFINSRIAPPGKKCALMLWTGNCLPEQDALAACAGEGLANMNGGIARFDRKFNSYSQVWPLSRPVGPYRQVYSSNCNDYIYTNAFKGPFQGMEQVLQTWENTGRDFLFRPMNLYYHFYSGERLASLNALQRLYGYAQGQRICPVSASEYAGWVQGFHRARITRERDGAWTVGGNGACRTVRFDTRGTVPDLRNCRNVQGYARILGSLYVTLGQGAESVIRMVPERAAKNPPYLISSNTSINAWEWEGARLRFSATSWQVPEWEIGGFAPGTPVAVERRTGGTVTEHRYTADMEGMILIRFPDIPMRVPVTLTVAAKG